MSMSRNEIVAKYLRTLGLQDRNMDLQFLKDLVGRHVATFAFSSVGCQLGDELSLDLEPLYQRIVIRRRGGYCFEQNGLLFEVLKELGFDPQLFLGRVILNKDIHPGLTHRISIVEYEGQQYLLDAGFGYTGPAVPVPMSGEEVQDGQRTFRIAQRRDGEYHTQVVQDGDFFSLYRFELARYGQADCELGHFYSHKHPSANFVNHLVVSRILKQETRFLINLNYSVSTLAGTSIRKVSGAQELERLLVGELGVRVTVAEAVRLYEKLSKPKAKGLG